LLPRGDTDQFVVDLAYETPDPVEPEWLESVDSRAPDQRLAPLRRRQPTKDAFGGTEGDATVVIEREARTDPVAVGAPPNAPVPVTYALPAPLVDTVPHEVGASLGEPADSRRVRIGLVQAGKGDHRHGTDCEHGVNAGREAGPVPHGVRGVRTEHRDADETGIEGAQPIPDSLPPRAERKLAPPMRLVDAVTQTHEALSGRSHVRLARRREPRHCAVR